MPARLILFIGLALTAMGQTVLFAVLGPVVRDIGLSEISAGAIISASALVVVMVSPAWGRATDRVGRKPVFVFALAGFVVMSAAFGLVLQAGMAGLIAGPAAFIALVMARVVYALAIAGGQPSAAGYIADTSSEAERAGAMATIGGAFAIGAICGPALAFALAPLGVLAPIYGAAGLGLIWALVAVIALPEPQRPAAPDTQSPTLRPSDPRLVRLLIGIVCVFTAIAMLQQTMAFYVQDLGGLDAAGTARRTGLLIGTLAMANLGAFVAVARVKPPPDRLIVLGGILAAVGAAVLFLSTALPLLLCANLLMGAGFGAFLPGAQAKASLSVSKTDQGAAAGLVAAAMAAGYVIGPILGTGLYMYATSATFLLATVVTVTGLAFARVSGKAAPAQTA
ncbi:MAG: MFS transporter [Pseudomonadota bacterium]